MDKKNLLKLLNDTEENDTGSSEGTRTLLIDGLNLFFRNFAMMNMVNPSGIHIGCLLYTSPSPRDRTRSRMPSSA